jgi:ditrans,polycis-polyprenyl diphosphate synthase
VSAIVSGVANGALVVDDVSEELLSNCLYTSPSRHPELLIRTSGEVRLSDFLLWQTSFSCIYFTATLWPEFKLWHMLAAVLHYQRSDAHLATLQEQHNATYIPSRTSTFIASVNDSRELVLS